MKRIAEPQSDELLKIITCLKEACETKSLSDGRHVLEMLEEACRNPAGAGNDDASGTAGRHLLYTLD